MCSCSGTPKRHPQPNRVGKPAVPTPAPAPPPNPNIPNISEGTNQHLINMQVVQAQQQRAMQQRVINHKRPISR